MLIKKIKKWNEYGPIIRIRMVKICYLMNKFLKKVFGNFIYGYDLIKKQVSAYIQ